MVGHAPATIKEHLPAHINPDCKHQGQHDHQRLGHLPFLGRSREVERLGSTGMATLHLVTLNQFVDVKFEVVTVGSKEPTVYVGPGKSS